MDEAEALSFALDDYFDIDIRLRNWDDQAKIKNKPLIDLQSLKEKSRNHLARRLTSV